MEFLEENKPLDRFVAKVFSIVCDLKDIVKLLPVWKEDVKIYTKQMREKSAPRIGAILLGHFWFSFQWGNIVQKQAEYSFREYGCKH